MIETLKSLSVAGGHSWPAFEGGRSFRNSSEGGYNLENPRTSWDRIFEVEPGYTGRSVTEHSALQATSVWACVRIISGAIGRIPLITYKRTEQGKQRATDHYLWKLFMKRANPFLSAYRFRRMMQAWCLLWGNAYADIEMSGRGQVINLWPWRPDRVRLTDKYGNPVTAMDRNQGTLLYHYTMNNGQEVTRLGDEILHLRGLETDGVMGLSPVRVARQSIGLGLAAEEYGARFFGNNGRPGGFISTPNKLGAEGRKNLRESFEDLHRGLRGAHRVAILEEGLKYTDVGIPPEDMQFLQTRQFQAIDIARLFGVPPHMIAELSRATFSNIENQGLDFVKFSMGDWFENWEQECELMLLSEREGANIFLEFYPDDLVKGDMESRYKSYSVGRMGGWLSVNKILERENENRIEGGDTYLQPLNMVPAADDITEAEDPAGELTDPDDPLDQPIDVNAQAAEKKKAAKKKAAKKKAAAPAAVEE